MLKKYIVEFRLPDGMMATPKQLRISLHGVLYAQFSPAIATKWHQSPVSPFAMFVNRKMGGWCWEVKGMVPEIIEELDRILLDEQGANIRLHLSRSTPLLIDNVQTHILSLQDLAETLSDAECPSRVRIHFCSVTSFKVKGQYQLFPDVRLIFQSLMMKYRWLTEGEYEANEQQLKAIVDAVRMTAYQIQSRSMDVHQAGISGFVGTVDVSINPKSPVRHYIYLLLKFAEFSGVGIKNALGMGHCRIEKLS